MSDLLALLVILILLVVGWNQPYSAHFNAIKGRNLPPPPTLSLQGAPGALNQNTSGRPVLPSPDRTWMFRKSPLDGPSRNGADPADNRGALNGR